MIAVLAISAFAAPSPVNLGIVSTIKTSSGVQINAAQVSTSVIDSINTSSAIKEVMGDKYTPDMMVVSCVNISVPEDTKFPITLEFTISGVDSDTTGCIAVYNADTDKWEYVEATFSKDKVTATFTFLGPTSIIVDGKSAAAVNSFYFNSDKAVATSPRTMDGSFTALAVFFAVVCMTGSAFAFKKAKENR